MKKLFLSLTLSLSASMTFACNPGVVGSGPSGDPNCMAPILSSDPLYNGSSNVTQPKTVIIYKKSKWGSIAYNNLNGDLFYVVGERSERVAEKKAIKLCENQNTVKGTCQIASTYANGCIASASGFSRSKGDWRLFSEVSENIDEAKQLALQECINDGRTDCRIIGTECSLP